MSGPGEQYIQLYYNAIFLPKLNFSQGRVVLDIVCLLAITEPSLIFIYYVYNMDSSLPVKLTIEKQTMKTHENVLRKIPWQPGQP